TIFIVTLVCLAGEVEPRLAAERLILLLYGTEASLHLLPRYDQAHAGARRQPVEKGRGADVCRCALAITVISVSLRSKVGNMRVPRGAKEGRFYAYTHSRREVNSTRGGCGGWRCARRTGAYCRRWL